MQEKTSISRETILDLISEISPMARNYIEKTFGNAIVLYAQSVFCKYFLEKVASCFSIVLQLHFPQCCKLSFPAKGERESLQAYVAEVD